ncbi:hypothetical protein [Bifidobacterium miconisargentati]|uniref:hypothetical protein n=1 Tax=Bifidobacterium miconisargentati TaxID=2834437 RepID=UPI001BDC1956|nr:hypothetical protein [Bifidobacterium miconisargentati]MBW3091033.1 hypothetical protein [Bifidobacterium miconisargentati]
MARTTATYVVVVRAIVVPVAAAMPPRRVPRIGHSAPEADGMSMSMIMVGNYVFYALHDDDGAIRAEARDLTGKRAHRWVWAYRREPVCRFGHMQTNVVR